MKKDVKRIITKDFEQGLVDEMISKLIPKFHASRDVVILTDGKDYKGVITEKQLTRTQLDISKTKAQKLMRHAPKINPKTTLGEAARLMLESNLFHLPVIENKKVVGVVKANDLLYEAIDIIEDYQAEEVMTKKIKTITPDTTLKTALITFREQGISRLPIEENGELVGIIGLHDIVKNALKPTEKSGMGRTTQTTTALDVPVSSLMRKEIIQAKKTATPREVFELMNKHDVSSIIIESKGIITRKDLLETLSYELNKQEKEVFIQISSKLEEINKDIILEEVKHFVVKNKSLGPGYIYIHVQKHKETHRKLPLLHLRLRVRCKDSFDITSEGYGEESTIKQALRKLKTLLLKSDYKIRPDEVMDYLDLDSH